MENNLLVKPIGKHSVYKFELINNYVRAWAYKLLENNNCAELIFIDCMCNCGEYTYNGRKILGTPLRVAKTLSDIAQGYTNKKITLYFNDIEANKINYLSKSLPPTTKNFRINLSIEDGNKMINKLGSYLYTKRNVHYLLLYDPFEASIDWNAIKPFLNRWGEVIINHMVSDSLRAIKMVKSDKARDKYEQTYLCSIEKLIPFGSDKNAYEERVSEIISNLRTNKRDYYVASFPFFNSRNAIVYDLIFCTNSIIGFKLFKECAWKLFDGHSSNKNTYGIENQYILDFDNNDVKNSEDAYCYTVHNIVDFIFENFKGKGKIYFNEVWNYVDMHPVFSSSGFRNIIKRELKKEYNVKISRNYFLFGEED